MIILGSIPGILVGIIAVYALLSGMVEMEYQGECLIEDGKKMLKDPRMLVRLLAAIPLVLGWFLWSYAKVLKYGIPLLIIVIVIACFFAGNAPQ